MKDLSKVRRDSGATLLQDRSQVCLGCRRHDPELLGDLVAPEPERYQLEGDLAFLQVLEKMGAQVDLAEEWVDVRPGKLQGVDLDLNHIPDAAMTVAMLGLFATGTTTIRNIYNWRVKETDRLAAMTRELTKLGAHVVEGEDSLAVTPPAALQPAAIDTYGDHRMAMCFSLAALGGVPITINDPQCVDKTFPEYFTEYERLAQR